MIKLFENWTDGKIDKSLFVSGRAKHNPKVIKKTIEYKTDNGKYVATIKQVGGEYLCKVYKIKEDGSRIRISKKVKDNLDNAHNFTREYLNDRLDGKKTKKRKDKKKKKSKKKKKDIDPLDKLFVDDIDDDVSFDFGSEKSSKTIIRRFT